MKIEGTREAFATLLQTRGIYKALGVDRSTVSNWRRTPPSLDKMEEMLLKSGAHVVK